ncbi:MAG: hypothetical protein A2V86_08080 [Deltaproteobacteria bacterium RBG_16_49_23]|nr:MAG: hypothetical protein A2V86_08080 [Deltaproteobacteria bacterium RBG_16_49_23]
MTCLREAPPPEALRRAGAPAKAGGKFYNDAFSVKRLLILLLKKTIPPIYFLKIITGGGFVKTGRMFRKIKKHLLYQSVMLLEINRNG